MKCSRMVPHELPQEPAAKEADASSNGGPVKHVRQPPMILARNPSRSPIAKGHFRIAFISAEAGCCVRKFDLGGLMAWIDWI